MWLYDVQQLGLGLIRQTHTEPLCCHTQLINGRHVVAQHHPVLVQYLRNAMLPVLI